MSRTRPVNHVEREEINTRIEALLAETPPDGDFMDLYVRIFKGWRESWTASRAAQLAATGAARTASAAADDADIVLDALARRWFPTVRDARGRSLTASLALALGVPTTSEVLELPYGEEVSRLTRLFAQIDSNPALTGDPGLMASVRAASESLGKLAAVDSVATAARVARTGELEVLTIAFDRAYGKLRRALEAVLGESWVHEHLPVFARRLGETDAGPPEPTPSEG